VPRLIVNADDLGLTGGVNRAILQAHQQGIVTSATLMANAQGFSEAVAFLRAMPEDHARKLSVGCHVVLVDGTPMSPAESIPSLLDPDAPGASFRKKLSKFALAALRGKISLREVEAEASAQIQKLQQAGVTLSHVDCHKHSHMFPVVLEGVLRAAAANGIAAIRNPFEPPFARPSTVKFKNALRSAETAMLHLRYARQFRATAERYGLATTDGSIGVTVTGALKLDLFAVTLRHLPVEGTYEFVCHPGYNDTDLSAAGTRLLQSRETELAVLCSPEARAELQAANVELINYWNLAPSTASNPSVSHPMTSAKRGL
jgi:hopanoid biosynthesis associated protein HpnK